MNADLIALPKVFMKRSTSPLAPGHSGVTRMCVKPRYDQKFLNSCPLNGCPLSVLISCGIPWRANIASSFGITVLLLVEWTISTYGKRLKSSMTTISDSPVGNGPMKSTDSSCHGASGRGDTRSDVQRSEPCVFVA